MNIYNNIYNGKTIICSEFSSPTISIIFLCSYLTLLCQKLFNTSFFLFSILVLGILKIGDKMPNMSILTIVVKSAKEKSLSTTEKLVRTLLFYEVEPQNLALMDSIHVYEKSKKKNFQ